MPEALRPGTKESRSQPWGRSRVGLAAKPTACLEALQQEGRSEEVMGPVRQQRR